MENNFSENVMLFAMLPNMKLLADDSMKGNKVYQLTVGGRKHRNGLYLEAKKGEISVKQGIYEGKPDCRLHFISAKSLIKYCLHKKGAPIVLGFYNPLNVIQFSSLISRTINMFLNKKGNIIEDEKQTIVRMYFNTIFSAINELGKAENENILNWIKDSPKKTYSLEVINNDKAKIWLTLQNGSCKVLLNQSTILTSQCALKFESLEDAIRFYNSDKDYRNSQIDKIAVIREDEVSRAEELKMLKSLLEEAFKYINK